MRSRAGRRTSSAVQIARNKASEMTQTNAKEKLLTKHNPRQQEITATRFRTNRRGRAVWAKSAHIETMAAVRKPKARPYPRAATKKSSTKGFSRKQAKSGICSQSFSTKAVQKRYVAAAYSTAPISDGKRIEKLLSPKRCVNTQIR